MQEYELRDFLEKFLRHHGLTEFSLAFEPFTRRGARRSKRGTAGILARDPSSGSALPGTRSVKDLFEKLHSLAPETREWFDNKQHTPRLYDDVGVRINEDELLHDLRNRAAVRQEEGERRARKVLLKAMQVCDQLIEPADVNRVVKTILAERSGR